MFENEWFPKANVMGITWQEFWSMNPHIINCIRKGYEEKLKQDDRLQHVWWGRYGISALVYAIDHCFNKHACSEYEKEPFFSISGMNGQLTEEEKQRELEIFIRQNERMRSGWKRKHRDGTVS